ncbi:Acetylcholine receptor subunit alpha-like 2, partial [Clonorchis sinensis]
FYDDLPTVIPDSHAWRGTLSAEEKLVAQLLNRGSLTVRPNGHNNKTTSPVFVDITYNVIQILAFVRCNNAIGARRLTEMHMWSEFRLAKLHALWKFIGSERCNLNELIKFTGKLTDIHVLSKFVNLHRSISWMFTLCPNVFGTFSETIMTYQNRRICRTAVLRNNSRPSNATLVKSDQVQRFKAHKDTTSYTYSSVKLNFRSRVDNCSVFKLEVSYLKWRDPRLTWDPQEFSDIAEVNVPSGQLWIPDVGVMNGKSSTDFDFSAGVRGRLTLSSQGEVTWLHGAVLDTTCPLDVAFFPFDYQTCFLILTPWQSNEQQLLLRPFTHGSAVDNSYLPNSNVSEWEIQSVHFSSRKYRSDLNVTYQYVSIGIHLRRQPLYFVVLVLVPFSMLSALACLIFTLDDTGDRLSVALSLVLSMTMYVVIVSTNAPRSMRTLPVLGIFLLDQLGLLSIATVLAVINNKLYQATELMSWQDWIYAISGTGESKKTENPHAAFVYNPPRVRSNYEKTSRKVELERKFGTGEHKLSRQKPTSLNSNHLSVQHKKDKGGCIANQFTSFDDEDDASRMYYSEEQTRSPLPYKKCNSAFRAYQRNCSSPIIGVTKSTNPKSGNAFQNREAWIGVGNIQHHPMCNHVTSSALLNDPCSFMPVCSNSKSDYRSPWVEPLTIIDQTVKEDEAETENFRNLSEVLDTEDSLNSEYDYNTLARPVPDVFETTISATAAATLAATKLLQRDIHSHRFGSLEGTRRKESKDHFGLHKEMKISKRRRLSLYSSDDEKDFGYENPMDSKTLTTRITAAAVAAAFHAAKMVQKHPGQNSLRNFTNSRSARHRFRRKLINKELTFPYRKLASRLDCIEMVVYLLLSTINAIVCLVIMPRFTQDKLPPKRWIT